MRVYIQIKQLGKRKCSIEKIPIDFPVPPVNVQGLIEAIVSWQVCEYNERLQQSEVLKYLTQEEEMCIRDRPMMMSLQPLSNSIYLRQKRSTV